MAEVQVTHKKSRLTTGSSGELSRTITVAPRLLMEQDQRQRLAAAFAAADPKPHDGQEHPGRSEQKEEHPK